MATLLLFLINRSKVVSTRCCKPPRASNPSTMRSAMVVLRKRGDGLSTLRWFRGFREIALSVILVLKSYSVQLREARWPPLLKLPGLPQFHLAPSTNFHFGPSSSPSTSPACSSIKCNGSAATGLLFPARDGGISRGATGLGRWPKIPRSLPPAMPPLPRCFFTLPTGHFPAPPFPWLSTIFHSAPPHHRVRPRMKPSPSPSRKTKWRLSVG